MYLKVATWNIRTLLDDTESNRPERRTAFIARELKRHNIDIAALSETRRHGEGSLREEGGGYTFYWKGYEAGHPRIHGVGFAIRNEILPKVSELPIGVSERLMTIKVQTANSSYATMISAYAPTLDAEDVVKESFYADLDRILTSVPNNDSVFLLGDFNARVGRDSHLWRGTIGNHGVGKINTNGTLLLSKCSEFDLCVTNTIFRQKNKYKTTWKHPRSKHWHLLDYVIVRTRDRKDIMITRAAPFTEDCWTDHRLVYSVIRLTLKMTARRGRILKRTKLKTERLHDSSTKQLYQDNLSSKLPDEYPQNTKEHWEKFKTLVWDSCSETIGISKHKHEDWFDENNEEITKLADETRKALIDHLNNPTSEPKRQKHRQLKAEVQRSTRRMKNEWWMNKSNEMQGYADRNDMKNFFSTARALYGPSSLGSAPLRNKDGTRILKSEIEILNRWREHFQELLNRDPVIDESAINEIPQQPIDETLDEIPTLDEVKSAIFSLKNNKAPGIDGLPAEVFKAGGHHLHSHFHGFLEKLWINEEAPEDLRDGLMAIIYKKKGDKSDCGNYRGIMLLSVAGKILAKILNNRLTSITEQILPESQNGFRPARGTTDMIFTVRQLQEKCREQQKPLYLAFIDLAKAFDSVKRELLWAILSKAGCPQKFIRILRLLHDNMSVTLTANGKTADPFRVKSGVKQGCVVAPTLFSVFIAAIMHLIKDQLPAGISIAYRMDGGVFNLCRLKARTKIRTTSLIEFQYADDNAICALTEADLQRILNAFADAYTKLGLSINVRKTQVLYQPAPNDGVRNPNIILNGETLDVVHEFAYLGSYVSADVNIDNEIQYRLRCASSAFGKLRARVFENRDLRSETRVMVYRSVVLPTLLYASETWTTYKHHIKTLEKFHQRCMRRILKINWQDHRTNDSILEESNCPSIEALIIQSQLRWAGHLVRMRDTSIPKQIFYSELSEGTRKVGRQKKRFKDCLKENMKICDINYETWERDAQDRAAWRAEIKEGAQIFQSKRKNENEARRARRAARRENPQFPLPPNNVCPHCGKMCRSRIGLISHLRIH